MALFLATVVLSAGQLLHNVADKQDARELAERLDEEVLPAAVVVDLVDDGQQISAHLTETGLGCSSFAD